MNRRHGGSRYETAPVEVDRNEGRSYIDLYRDISGSKKHVARLTFWDASGQFYLETFGDIAVEIVEDLIQEGKEKIEIR
jgi:hypothetical protein